MKEAEEKEEYYRKFSEYVKGGMTKDQYHDKFTMAGLPVISARCC